MNIDMRQAIAFSILQRCARVFDNVLARVQLVCRCLAERRFRNKCLQAGLRNTGGPHTLEADSAQTVAFFARHNL